MKLVLAFEFNNYKVDSEGKINDNYEFFIDSIRFLMPHIIFTTVADDTDKLVLTATDLKGNTIDSIITSSDVLTNKKL